MIDKQLITILECCASDENIECCKKCDLCKKYDCYSEISKNALNLISRQKAEIEQLKSERMYYMDRFHERAKTDKCIREEAIKEFAERLKENAKTEQIHYSYRDFVEVRDIDEIVKEMTEVKEDGK